MFDRFPRHRGKPAIGDVGENISGCVPSYHARWSLRLDKFTGGVFVSDPRVGLLFDPSPLPSSARRQIRPRRRDCRCAISSTRNSPARFIRSIRAPAKSAALLVIRSVSALPEAPDVAILMVDAKLIAGSSGRVRQERRQDRDHRLGRFQRIGPEGQERQDEVSAIAKTLRHPRLRPQLPRHF